MGEQRRRARPLILRGFGSRPRLRLLRLDRHTEVDRMTNPFSPISQTSGTYLFNPTGGEFILNAFDRIQIRPTEIEATQMSRAIMELNFALARFNTMPGQNLWTIDLISIPLVQGTATYSVDAETRM